MSALSLQRFALKYTTGIGHYAVKSEKKATNEEFLLKNAGQLSSMTRAAN